MQEEISLFLRPLAPHPMPISKSSFTRITAILLVIGLAALVAIVGTSLWLVERTQVYFEEVVEAREGRAAAADLRNSMQEIDSSQRGFLISGEERHLDDFYTAREAIDPGYLRLGASGAIPAGCRAAGAPSPTRSTTRSTR
jgi:hypothetical protein